MSQQPTQLSDEIKSKIQVELGQLFAEMTVAFVNLKSFYERAVLGIEVVAPIIYRDNIEFTSKHLPGLLLNAGAPPEEIEMNEDWHTSAAERAVREASERNRAIIDSSTLVLAHSLFDGYIEDIVLMTRTAYPEFWYSRVSKRKVEIDEVKADGFEKIRDKMIDNVVKEKNRESVLIRCEILMSLLQPQVQEVFATDFRYDLDLLKEIDEKRHAVVHKTRKYVKIERLGSYIDYLEKFNSFFVIGFLRRLGLKLDARTVVGVLGSQ